MIQEFEEKEKRKIQVTAYYTSTADDGRFNADRNDLLRQVIDEGYQKLGQHQRDGDQYFTHSEPRIDLMPYLGHALGTLVDQGIGLDEDGHGKARFEFDIDVIPGGA